ncbi:hypothetical protein ACFL6I_24095 [candidate division KSB1 bacterium]
MGEKTRFRVNIKTGVIELEGNQKFVKEQIKNLPELINSISAGDTNKAKKSEFEETEHSKSIVKEKVAPKKLVKQQVREPKVAKTNNEFIDWMKNYKPELKQVENVLLCGYYTQKRTSNQPFRTSDVSKLLKDINVKVSNITSTLYLLNRNKKVEITETKGRTSFFKVTTVGEKYLVSLLK